MEIQNHPNYLIYPDGKVFSKKSNKYLKARKNQKTEYMYVDLYYDVQKKTTHLIHRLVAIHYIPNPDNLNEVDHINRIRDDNRVENLRWATRSLNSLNRGNQKNSSGFKWITLCNTRNIYWFQRKDCKRKSSKNLSKLLGYSFFYILKLSTHN